MGTLKGNQVISWPFKHNKIDFDVLNRMDDYKGRIREIADNDMKIRYQIIDRRPDKGQPMIKHYKQSVINFYGQFVSPKTLTTLINET